MQRLWHTRNLQREDCRSAIGNGPLDHDCTVDSGGDSEPERLRVVQLEILGGL